MRAVVRQRSECVVGTCRTDSIVHHHNFRIFGSPERVESSCHFLCFLHACTDRELEIYSETSVILSREELSSDKFHKEYRTHEDTEADNDCQRTVCDNLAKQRSVAVIEFVKSAFDMGIPVLFVAVGSLPFESEPLAAEHRG